MAAVRRYQAAYDEFTDFITSSPSLAQIVEFRLSNQVEARIDELMDKNNNSALTAEETAELDDFLRLEHIMRMAKLRALQKLSV